MNSNTDKLHLDSVQWQAGFNAGAAGEPTHPATTLSFSSGYIEGKGGRRTEGQMAARMCDEIGNLRRTDPEYFARFEDVDIDSGPRHELIELMNSAPNERVKYFLFGKYSARVALSASTGRDFI